MTPTESFLGYALDFEQTYDDDDWTRLERHFAPDAVYEVRNTAFACRLEGVPAILRGLKKSLDGFDRRFAKRTLDLVDGPKEEGDTVSVGWTATYAAPGAGAAAPFVLRGRSTARFRDGVIVHLADDYPVGTDAGAGAWLAEHCPGADPSYV
jgi:hypothetical protein